MSANLPLAMTPSIRLHVDAPLSDGATIDATPAQAHYLGGVMRRAAGDSLRLFNGVDGEYAAVIVSIRRDRAQFAVAAQLRPQAATADLWLVFAALKRDATDLVIQKATELGVAAILPVTTERTNTGRLNDARLVAIATEAAEQCERLTLPRIAPLARLDAILADWPQQRRLVAALERSDAPKIPDFRGPAALLVGPEGGFTATEVEALRRHPFVHPATLGPLVLRAETAAIVGLGLLQFHSAV